MEWLRNFDWGALILIGFVLSFGWLVIKAVRKMRRKAAAKSTPKTPKRRGKLKPARRPRSSERHRSEEEVPDDGDAEDDAPAARTSEAPRKRTVRASKGGRRKGGANKGRPGKRKARRPQEAEPSPKDLPSETEAPQDADAEETGESERDRLTRGLAKTRGGFISRLGKLFAGKPTFDETMLEKVEEVLFTADIGARTADELIQSIRKQLGKKVTDPATIWTHLEARAAAMLSETSQADFDFVFDRGTPFVLLMVGVNGTGKTTTIGKIAQRLKLQGKRVLLAAGDTYRAAAAEQLMVWGDRAGVEVIRRKEGSDPSSVIVDAIKKAQAEDYDVVICDTAGRLQTNVALMEELKKVPRSIAKHVKGAPHETFLVLDATTGQNAITQAKMFRETLEITGLVLTKLDGTAKGGVILGIAHELGLPVRFIGIGEQADDLRPFDPQAFAEALFSKDDDNSSGVSP